MKVFSKLSSNSKNLNKKQKIVGQCNIYNGSNQLEVGHKFFFSRILEVVLLSLDVKMCMGMGLKIFGVGVSGNFSEGSHAKQKL